MNELKDLIAQGEHQQQDFKLRIEDQKKIARTLCAFANTDGGRILVGLKDNGKVMGIDPNEQFFMVEGAANQFCKPPVVFRSTVIQDDYKYVLSVEIEISVLKPHKAIDEKGEWRSYVRAQDKTLAVNKIIEKVWSLKKSLKSFESDLNEEERKILELIKDHSTVSISKLYKEGNMPLKNVDRSLVSLICRDIVEFFHSNGEVFYRISKT
jgi:predicted HTH transcriptional regulator